MDHAVTTQRVLEGLDGARRAAWARYYETNDLVLELMAVIRVADNMLEAGAERRARNLLGNVHTWATKRELHLSEAEKGRIEDLVDTAIDNSPLMPGGRRLAPIGWPGKEGYCV